MVKIPDPFDEDDTLRICERTNACPKCIVAALSDAAIELRRRADLVAANEKIGTSDVAKLVSSGFKATANDLIGTAEMIAARAGIPGPTVVRMPW